MNTLPQIVIFRGVEDFGIRTTEPGTFLKEIEAI
jgi:hypothetical protein